MHKACCRKCLFVSELSVGAGTKLDRDGSKLDSGDGAKLDFRRRALEATGVEFDVWGVYQGSFAYRYPYDVKLSGCTPGSPRNTLADSENWDLSGGDPREHDNSLRMDFPVPQDQPGYEKMVQRLNALKPGLPALEERVINGDLYVQPWWKHNTAGKAIMLFFCCSTA